MTVFRTRSLAAFEAGTGDITVVASDGTEIKAHSFVLCHSPVIEAALSGKMKEAACRRMTIDCSAETAKVFLKFLYTGLVSADSVASLDVIVDLIRLADFYAVDSELSTACSGESQGVVSAVLDSVTWQITDFAIVRSLRQLSQIRSQHACEMLKQCIQRIDPQFGKNMFEWLCTFESMCALELCTQVLKMMNRTLPSRDGTWLQQEFSKDALVHLLGAHFKRPHLLLVALPAYFEILGCAAPSSLNATEAEVGEIGQTRDGRCGVLLEVRKPEIPATPKTASGFVSIFEPKLPSSKYHVQFGHASEWGYQCLTVHDHTLMLNLLPQVLSIVTECVFSCEQR